MRIPGSNMAAKILRDRQTSDTKYVCTYNITTGSRNKQENRLFINITKQTAKHNIKTLDSNWHTQLDKLAKLCKASQPEYVNPTPTFNNV